MITTFLSCLSHTKNDQIVEVKESLEITQDYKDVEAAILDYVEGIYEVDSTYIERSIHPELRKRGYWYNKDKKKYYDNLDMSYKQLVHLAAT